MEKSLALLRDAAFGYSYLLAVLTTCPTIGCSLTSSQLEQISARFAASRRRVTSFVRGMNCRRPPVFHQVVLTNRVCKSREVLATAERLNLTVLWREDIERFWRPKVLLAAVNHVNYPSRTVACFFPSRSQGEVRMM